MRIHSRSERFVENGADHPCIDINIETNQLNPSTQKLDTHWAAIQVHGAELCDLAEQVLNFCNVPISEYH